MYLFLRQSYIAHYICQGDLKTPDPPASCLKYNIDMCHNIWCYVILGIAPRNLDMLDILPA